MVYKEVTINNKDGLNATTAAAIYNVPLMAVTKEQRRHAKAVNFGLIYGISAFGLSQRLNIPRKEAAEITIAEIEKYVNEDWYEDPFQLMRDIFKYSNNKVFDFPMVPLYLSIRVSVNFCKWDKLTIKSLGQPLCPCSGAGLLWGSGGGGGLLLPRRRRGSLGRGSRGG